MMRSLFSGVTGLKAHQTKMDVLGNNISNVNTIGFKKSNVTFSDLFSETSSIASGATGTIGGINAKQIGLGSQVGSIATIHTPGSTQYTGNPTDFAIQGDGFFVIRTPEKEVYTRAGNFGLDANGTLVTQDGNFVLGYPVTWKAGIPAVPPAPPAPGTPAVPGEFIPGQIPNGTTDMVNITIDEDLWSGMTIDGTGAIIVQAKEAITTGGISAGPPAIPAAGEPDIAKGAKVIIGYVGLATFTNPGGLEKIGGNNYDASANSGDPAVGRPSDAGYGKMVGSSVEMSNVDLSEEMVNMIVTQRGFQANSRIITVSDTILEELINLKR